MKILDDFLYKNHRFVDELQLSAIIRRIDFEGDFQITFEEFEQFIKQIYNNKVYYHAPELNSTGASSSKHYENSGYYFPYSLTPKRVTLAGDLKYTYPYDKSYYSPKASKKVTFFEDELNYASASPIIQSRYDDYHNYQKTY